jgi:large subunit ribosomal protein L24
VVDDDRVVVSGVNMIKKHTKPEPQAGVQGGIVEREAPMQVSNVAIFNPATGKADRVGFRVEDGKQGADLQVRRRSVDASRQRNR